MSIIKSFSVGNGDMFYIDHNSDNFSIIDCCMDDTNNRTIVAELEAKIGQKGIIRFISTHPDEDHIKGLKYLNDKLDIPNFYCVENKAAKKDESDDFKYYCELRDGTKVFHVSKGCSRRWINLEDEERGAAGINFLWPDLDNNDYREALKQAAAGTAFNNISPIFTYGVNDGVSAMWMGDLEHEFQEKIKDYVKWPQVDILFAPHHGRKSGHISAEILEKLSPKIIIIGEAPSKYLNYYQGYNTITQNTAKDITFNCVDKLVHIYFSEKEYKYDLSFLTNISMDDSNLGYYKGSFIPYNATR